MLASTRLEDALANLNTNGPTTPPSDVIEARCEGALAWRTHDDDSFGRIRLAPVAWPDFVTEDAAGIENLFTRIEEPVGLQATVV